MQSWTKLREELSEGGGSLQDMVDQLLKDKRKSGGNFAEQRAKQDDLKNKMERRKKRSEDKKAQLEQEAKDSYLNLEQFEFLQKNIEMAGKRLKEQQMFIDMMEGKMIKQLENRRKREAEMTAYATKASHFGKNLK